MKFPYTLNIARSIETSEDCFLTLEPNSGLPSEHPTEL
jgi:hypothetical protein